jgi:ornithine carbamoyltransferase
LASLVYDYSPFAQEIFTSNSIDIIATDVWASSGNSAQWDKVLTNKDVMDFALGLQRQFLVFLAW